MLFVRGPADGGWFLGMSAKPFGILSKLLGARSKFLGIRSKLRGIPSKLPATLETGTKYCKTCSAM